MSSGNLNLATGASNATSGNIDLAVGAAVNSGGDVSVAAGTGNTGGDVTISAGVGAKESGTVRHYFALFATFSSQSFYVLLACKNRSTFPAVRQTSSRMKENSSWPAQLAFV